MPRTLLVEIITPERIVYTNEVEMVVAPTIDGEIGVLPLHAPLVSVLRPGEIRVKWNAEKDVEWFAVSGGYIQVHEDKVIILADDAIVVSKIDLERARRALQLAKQRVESISEKDVDAVSACERDLRWCELQVELAERHK
jgi:F-type H+-transporting ATPase subunit epsilon